MIEPLDISNNPRIAVAIVMVVIFVVTYALVIITDYFNKKPWSFRWFWISKLLPHPQDWLRLLAAAIIWAGFATLCSIGASCLINRLMYGPADSVGGNTLLTANTKSPPPLATATTCFSFISLGLNGFMDDSSCAVARSDASGHHRARKGYVHRSRMECSTAHFYRFIDDPSRCAARNLSTIANTKSPLLATSPAGTSKVDNSTQNFILSLTQFPGALFVFSLETAGIMGLLNTMLLLRLRSPRITNFRMLLDHFRWKKDEVIARLPPGATPHHFAEKAYLVEATPRIGEISNKGIEMEFINALTDLAGAMHCECHYIFLASAEYMAGRSHRLNVDQILAAPLESFYVRTLGPNENKATLHQDVVKLVKSANATVDQLDGRTASCWRSDQIIYEHYYITSQAAISYHVTPEHEKPKNQIEGLVTTELANIAYLSRVADDYLRNVITPVLATKNGDTVKIRFRVGQNKIKFINVTLYKEKEENGHIYELRIDLSSDNGWLDPVKDYECKPDLTKLCKYDAIKHQIKWLRVQLIKEHCAGVPLGETMMSPHSNFVVVET